MKVIGSMPSKTIVILTCNFHQSWITFNFSLGRAGATSAGKFLQRIQHLGLPDADGDLLVLALGGKVHAVRLVDGLHLLPVASEVDHLSVSHPTRQDTIDFF